MQNFELFCGLDKFEGEAQTRKFTWKTVQESQPERTTQSATKNATWSIRFGKSKFT